LGQQERAGAVQESGNVLLVDDDVELCTMLDSYLSRHGWKVTTVHNGQDGISAAHTQAPALIILDGMLPDMDGFDVLRRIRATDSVPVLLLTARGEEVDRIVGLEMGADDYIGKPFNPRELLARMRAISRRTVQREETSVAEPDFTVAEARREVCFRREPLDLTDIEYRLLVTLLQRAPAVVDREDLTVAAFERPSRPFDRSLDMHISRLRRKLEVLGGFAGTIKSVRNSGYLLVHGDDGGRA
jgi:two-component system, OmpR family, response regulator CpxR